MVLITKSVIGLNKQVYSDTLENSEEGEEQQNDSEKKLLEEDDLFSHTDFYFNAIHHSISIRWIEHQSQLCSSIISKNTPPPKFYI